jgi:hypothetical protein
VLVKRNCRERRLPIQFQNDGQLFTRTNNKTLSVAAMRVCKED